MIREYQGRVRRRQVVIAALLLVGSVSGLVALTTWLGGGVQRGSLPAPAEPSSGKPGALVCPSPSAIAADPAQQVGASELIDCPDDFHDRQVVYTGEVIEAVFSRSGRRVVVLNDDDYALGPGPLPQTRTALGGNSGITVVLPAGFTRPIEHLGSYASRGDHVRVVGRFVSASSLLQGEPAIEATRASVVLPGGPIRHDVPPRMVVAAVIVSLTATALTALARRDPMASQRRTVTRS
jgi:hypothetical protein